jgi:seryl-tRNA synthetase
MKTAFTIIAVLAIVHILAGLSFVGWLAGTNRLNKDRLKAAKAVFALTIDQEQDKEAEQAAAAEAAKVEAERQARLSGVGGLASTADRLAEDEKRNEVLLRQLERTRREIEALSDNLTLARQRMERQHADLLTAKKDLEQRIKQMEARLNDEGFKKAVALFESLPSKQVKQMFIELIESNQADDVVAYLEAMEPRKAAGVLKEFKDDREIDRAVDLTQRLRERGSDLVREVESTG